MERLIFEPSMLIKPKASGIDAETTLEHFAIITYYVDLKQLQKLLSDRFEPVCVIDPMGVQRGLISVVPFLDLDFRYVNATWFQWTFGQTNYRAYVKDKVTGEQVVWFFGTSLDSIMVAIPRFCWKLPWHRGKIRFGCQYDPSENRYQSYQMKTESRWAPAELELIDTGCPPESLPGFADLETAMVILTHPLKGYYYRRDARVGSYHIWHERIQPTLGKIKIARFGLLERLGLINDGETSMVHSVLLQNKIKFTIYLPPTRV